MIGTQMSQERGGVIPLSTSASSFLSTFGTAKGADSVLKWSNRTLPRSTMQSRHKVKVYAYERMKQVSQDTERPPNEGNVEKGESSLVHFE